MLGGTEWLVIFFAVLLLFGGQKIPELMRGLGKGIREFNAARSSIEAELREGMREADRRHEEERKRLQAQLEEKERQLKQLETEKKEEVSNSDNTQA
ncbi:MAG: twin-arginine translocase TatA/TatE family subunit [Saprospiraceae bacterium]